MILGLCTITLHIASPSENRLYAAQDDQCKAHSRASAATVTAWAAQPTNQRGHKHRIGILA